MSPASAYERAATAWDFSASWSQLAGDSRGTMPRSSSSMVVMLTVCCVPSTTVARSEPGYQTLTPSSRHKRSNAAPAPSPLPTVMVLAWVVPSPLPTGDHGPEHDWARSILSVPVAVLESRTARTSLGFGTPVPLAALNERNPWSTDTTVEWASWAIRRIRMKLGSTGLELTSAMFLADVPP